MTRRGIAAIAAILVTVAGLGSCVGGDPDTETSAGNDAGSGSDTAIDAGTDATDAAKAPACDLDAAFGAPTLVPGAVNSASDDPSLSLSPDELTIYLASNRHSDAGPNIPAWIYTGTRASVDASFTVVTPQDALNAVAVGYGVGNPAVSADGKTIYFANAMTGTYDLWTAERGTTTVAFPDPQLVAKPINQDGGGAGEDFVGWISPDGTTLYFLSNRPGSNARDIYQATRAGAGAFNPPTPVAALNSASDEDSVILTPDELQAFIGRGNGEMFYSRRADKSAGFSPPALITELNTEGGDTPVWVTADGCTLYFSTNGREAGPGGYDIYYATRGK